MSDKVVMSAEEMQRAIGIAMDHRDRLVEDITKAFPDRPEYLLCVALAGLFASSMTSDQDQQVEQAKTLNNILERWASHRVPWRLVPSQ